MSNLLPVLATYVPPVIVRLALAGGRSTIQSDTPLAEHFPAAILFADVSGFTPLTEALAQKGVEGPEELTRLLNTYFSRMIALIEAEGGEVVKFSGDAVTVVFPATDRSDLAAATLRAKRSAEAMQAAMAEFTTLETSVGPVALGMKIGLGAGEILAVQVGGMRDRWEYVIAGDPLRQVAEAEHQAERGQIILSPEAETLLAEQPLAPPTPLRQPDWSAIQIPEEAEDTIRAFVPGSVTARLEEELHAWLADLRPMSVLFIGIGGLDYTQKQVVPQLHQFVRDTQTIIYRYEGSINKLTVDDKGTVLIILFGAPPYSHEDDPERALRCAVDLQQIAPQHQLRLAIGVTTGRVFAGPVGSDTRREYTVMGDTVNLAARLMGVAGAGEIRADYETYRSAQHRIAFDILSAIRVKGKAGLIRVYRPTGEAAGEPTGDLSGALVGRQAEMAQFQTLLAAFDQAAQGPRCLLIQGEAGIGKSRLVEEMKQQLRQRGFSGLIGAGRSIEQQTPYRAWRDIFNSYFALDTIEDPAERRRLVSEQVQEVLPDQLERLPLLNDILSLGLPENTLTQSLDTNLRHQSLITFLLALLQAWDAGRALVLIIEDAHWLDTLSWDLMLQVMRAFITSRIPLFLITLMRPLEGESMRIEPSALAAMNETIQLTLEALSPEETIALAAARLDVLPDALPPAVSELILNRAGGNPFFAEELVYALRDNEFLAMAVTDGGLHWTVRGDLSSLSQTLPETIEGIVLSRIDRLPAEEQLALKVAAVIGRTFGFSTLRDTLGGHMEIRDRLLRTYLDDLAHLDLTPLEAPEPELTYIFKHIITQEVAYQTLLFAQRRQLHRSVAEWYEQKYSTGQTTGDTETDPQLAPYYPLLVYHWHQAEDSAQERRYAQLAGHWAAAQFANVEADAYFSRAIALTPDTDLNALYDLFSAREAVNDLRGERQAQAEDVVILGLLADQLADDRKAAQAALRQANYLEVTSDYGAALTAAQQAVDLAHQADDSGAEAEGYIAWGKALWRQGDYEVAREPLQKALELAHQVHMSQAAARSLYYLGHVHLYQGDYPVAQSFYQQALEIYRQHGDRLGEADSLSMLGVIFSELSNYPAAITRYQQAVTTYQMIGDRLGEAIPLGNLGNVYCDLGDYEAARTYHQQALDIRLTIDDRWGEGASLVNLGLVNHDLGENETARQQCERALEIQREIGDRRGQGYSLTYLGHALADLGELEAAAQTYTQAAELRRELGQESLAIDALAGQARVKLALGDMDTATTVVQEILSWIEANGTEGIEYPLQVYLTCYQVLNADAATQKPLVPNAALRAEAALSAAYAALQSRAIGINDPELQHSFLTNVRTNREIATAWVALYSA